jgi:hypothetical protein
VTKHYAQKSRGNSLIVFCIPRSGECLELADRETRFVTPFATTRLREAGFPPFVFKSHYKGR